jgi:GT2 family glycosyltransferase/glycosyltransferase involved in cell wall biosynthesis
MGMRVKKLVNKIWSKNNWRLLFLSITRLKNNYGLISGLIIFIEKFKNLSRQEFIYKLKKFIKESDGKAVSILSVRLELLLDEIKSRFDFSDSPVDFPLKASSPKISIILPVYKVDLIFLEQAIQSVLWQSYENWELCIVDDGSDREEISSYLTGLSNLDGRVKVLLLETNVGISGASNEALKMVTGDFIALLDHDDMLTNDALLSIVYEINRNDQADVFYSDECKIDTEGNPKEIFTKPDWSPVLMFNCMYIGHLGVYRTSLINDVGGFRSEFNYSQDYDLALRVTEKSRSVVHVEKVLYGWRMIESSASAGGKPYAKISNVAALQQALCRRGLTLKAIALPFANRPVFDHNLFKSLVSIIIPSDNLKHILDTIESIEINTSYANYEIVVVTNSNIINQINIQGFESTLKFVDYNKPYNFSDKCNAGFAKSDGDYVVFFNDDVRVVTSDWIECILEYLTLDNVGIVGPKLIYENKTLQHAGMVTGTRKLVGTAFHALPMNTGTHYNFAQSVREVSLICGACLGIKRKVFEDIGGFDEINTPINHSDVDLCLKVKAAGLSCIYTPYAQLVHIGHLSLADVDKKKKLKPYVKDKADIWLLRRWAKDIARDPYFTKSMRELIYHDSPSYYEIFPSGNNGLATKKDVLLVSHDLSESGAPRVLFEMAISLLNDGYFVVVASPSDGPMIILLNNIGVNVIVDELLLKQDQTVLEFARNFDVVIANTIVSWPILKQLSPYVDVFLYVHEMSLVSDIDKINEDFRASLLGAKRILVGSDHSKKIMLNYVPEENIDILSYGIEDISETNSRALKYNNAQKFKVAMFGSFESRKGQDLLLSAIGYLPPSIRDQCEFYFYGRILDQEFYDRFILKSKKFTDVKVSQDISYNAYIKEINSIDFLVVPSREDTLPLVSLHGLAASKVLICSRDVGTSSFIEHGKSGFIVEQNNPLNIAIILNEAIVSNKLKEISKNGRKVFDSNFSRKTFSEKFIKLINV